LEQVGQPQTLWQAARMARRLDNPDLVSRFGLQLRTRFGQSPQAAAFDKGSWDE
jgi:type IV pilus assembly protein PilF